MTANILKQHRFHVALAFALVYVLWGSTYLAMRVAVEHIPPFVMGGARYLVAGPLMLAWCVWSGRNIRLTGRDFRSLLAVGVLLLTVGNMGVAWAELYVPSGLAALIVALVPIWVAIIQAWVFRSARLSMLGLVGLALGIVGLVVLLWPRIKPGTHLGQLEMFGVGLLVLAALGWAMGSVLAGRWALSVDVFTASAWQMTIGGTVNLIIALVTGQFHQTQWTARGLSAIIYLVICGSWIGFSAYGWLLEHVATPKVATYAYVNPVVAVYLGWLFLNEKTDGFMLAGTVIIVAAVALVNVSKLKSMRKNTALAEMPLVEPAGD